MSITFSKSRAAWLTTLCASSMLACADTDAIVTRADALSAGGLSVSGSSTQDPLTGDELAHLFSANINVTNQTSQTVTIEKQMFTLAAPGGFAYTPSVALPTQGSIPPGGTASSGGGFGFSAPIAHIVQRFDGRTSSGTPVAGLGGIAVIAPGYAPPGPSPFVDDVNVGVMAPIEIQNVTGGERWLQVTGSVLDTTGTATAPPTLTIRARNSAGSTIATLNQTWGPHDAEGVELPYYWTFIAWTVLPASASVANVRLTASQGIFNGTASQTRTIPVVTASPTSIVSPVSGSWFWNNGPGQPFWHVHAGGRDARYAYDINVVRAVSGQVVSFQGDPRVNSSYFCWDQPIRAAMTGTVVKVFDDSPDNNGNEGNVNGNPNNEVIIQHPNNVFSIYAHLRQGTATVTKGQTVYAGSVIGLVGNAGNASEPHLHFHMVKIDATGRLIGVPFTIPGIRSASGASLSGIPKAGFAYQTP